jgi:oligoribonuclease NrnB/cAMP/cGMP phosphodiesterase (DHH superfamily)
MKKTIVFTDSDLDGSMSYLLLDWCTTTKLPYKTTTVTKFHDDFIAWSRKNDVASYDNIYILDLDVSQKSLELVDKPNITIIDHHTTHVENKNKYKNAKVYVTEYPSCAKLVYKLFKKKLDNVVDSNKKKLLLLVDDYDSWTHQYPQSKQLNYIYWNYQGDRLQAFMKDFQFGFKGFTPDQSNIVKFYENKLKKTISNLSYHRATISIQKQDVKCVCTFADTLISDIGNHLIDIGYDIGFVVNLSSNRVSVRKNKSCSIDLGKLSKWLIDGGGHECAAGGMCTDKFLQFSKLFSPITNGTR